ncbi:hypothetical protein M8C13_16920 [Crossiella sp. SN42]|uniref:hypothetical protein n=1 Tax=Crossiella sp. SN42 TaxID=2944808 RepID=UPI00207CB6A4|nr:hypothetical protein [Crossiella sp. SN42]MCO1577441.1 hypothetical protein [Crossiella sp. SN42]
MTRRLLTVAALALAAFGVSAPLAQAAPAPISFGHEQGKFTGTKDTVCNPIIGCTYKLEGTLSTAGAAEDCYQVQWTAGTAWGAVNVPPACGAGEHRVARGFPWPGARPTAFRLCLVSADGTVRSCGTQQAS